MYVNGFVLAVPADKKEAYREVAEKFWAIAKDYGARSQVECWEVDVPDGKTTDFRRAVKCEEGKETADASHDKMMTDPRMKDFGAEDGSDMPFDGKRMIYGGFEPLVWQEA